MDKLKDFLKRNGVSILKISFVVLIVIFIITGITKEIKSIDFAETTMLIRSLSIPYVLILTTLAIISIALITLYDFIIVKHLGIEVKNITVFNVAFVASTVNNISGLGGLIGASIRSILFKKGAKDVDDIIDYNLLLVPATAIGLSILSLVSIVEYKFIAPIINEYKILLLGLIGFCIYLIIYFFIDKIFYAVKKTEKVQLNQERLIIKVKLLIVSIVQWIFAYLLFSVIIRYFNKDIKLYGILGVFTLGSIAGIISMLPGGVGSFDLVALIGLGQLGMPSEHILASLILYRIFYYMLPLVLGIIFTLILQGQNKNDDIRLMHLGKLKNIINQASGLTNILLSILIFFSGVVLLTSALVPGIATRIKLAAKLMSFPILQLSNQLSITAGVLLITISKDISMKVKRSYKFTWWLLLLGAIFTFLKGFDYEEAIFLGIVLILLRMSKTSFYRRSTPFDWFWTLISSIFALIGVIIYFRLSHIIIMDFLKIQNFKAIFSSGFISFRINSLITYGSFIAFLLIRELTKEQITNDQRYEKLDEEKLKRHLETYGGSLLSHLLFLNDKHVFWASSSKVVIAFEKSHNLIIVLGDPIGDPAYFGEAIDEFQNFIDEYGYKSIFYEVSDNLLSLYHSYGYYFFKLGETALVDLEEFDISIPKSRDFRNILSRFKRDGYTFEFRYEGKMDNDLYDELLKISNEWLGDRNEMGFSLGFMDKGYLDNSPLGLIRKSDTDEIIAFASLMPKYDNNRTMSIDLMRFKKDIPSNTMAFLILNLMLKLKEDGYKVLNLGMAPLSNVGDTRNAHFMEKLAHLVFKYGNNIYSFGGLRKYKEKFNPNWESRYLVYEDLRLLPSSLIEATILIHSKK